MQNLILVNPIFQSGLICFFISQMIKSLIELIHGNLTSFSKFIKYFLFHIGGIPSSHAAIATSLSTTIGLKYGLQSDLFVFSIVFLLVLLRDSLGVRRTNAFQSKTINGLGNRLKNKGILEDYSNIKESYGHTPIEIITGCILGIVIGFIFNK